MAFRVPMTEAPSAQKATKFAGSNSEASKVSFTEAKRSDASMPAKFLYARGADSFSQFGPMNVTTMMSIVAFSSMERAKYGEARIAHSSLSFTFFMIKSRHSSKTVPDCCCGRTPPHASAKERRMRKTQLERHWCKVV